MKYPSLSTYKALVKTSKKTVITPTKPPLTDNVIKLVVNNPAAVSLDNSDDNPCFIRGYN